MDKPKKERTEAQKKATASMLARLKENREKGISKPGRKKKDVKSVEVDMPESESDVEEVVHKAPEKVVVKEVIKEVPVEPKYLTKEDLHAFKNEIASLFNPAPPVVVEKQTKKAKKVRTITEDEDYEEPVRVAKPVVRQSVQQPLTGYSLLDKLLNR